MRHGAERALVKLSNAAKLDLRAKTDPGKDGDPGIKNKEAVREYSRGCSQWSFEQCHINRGMGDP